MNKSFSSLKKYSILLLFICSFKDLFDSFFCLSQYFFHFFLEFAARHHDHLPTFQAFDADVNTHSDDFP